MSQLIHRRVHAPEVLDEPYDVQDLRLPKKSSLALVLIGNVLLQMSFFIMISSSNLYCEHLGGDATFNGIVIGVPAAVAALALIPITKFGRDSYLRPFHLTCSVAILGHVLYGLAYYADWLYLILIGRMLSGVSFTGFMYSKRYCSDPLFVGTRRRTTLASLLVLGQGLGMSAGPFFGGLLYKVGFRNNVFNGYTAPAWVMVVVWTVYWICLTKWFEDPILQQSLVELSTLGLSAGSSGRLADSNPSLHSVTVRVTATQSHSLSLRAEPEAEVQQLTGSVALSKMTLPQWGVTFTMCWFSMTCFFVLGAWEANLPVFGAPGAGPFEWSPFAAGNFIALGGICAFPVLVGNVFLAPKLQDRHILAFGSTLGGVGLVIFAALLGADQRAAQNVEHDPMVISFGSLFVCWWAIAIGFNIASTVTVSLLSKQLPPEWSRWTSLAIQYANYTGRVSGAIWGGSGVKIGMQKYVGLEIGVLSLGMLCFVGLWKDLKAKKG